MKFNIDVLLSSPFFESLQQALVNFQQDKYFPDISELNQKLSVDGIKFVQQASKSHDFSSGYEPRIYEKGEVQTRDRSWHDFFNALVWDQFTKTKKIINGLHYHLQRQRLPEKKRLPAENMLTLFDENGVIVLSQDPELLELIRQQHWKKLFWERRESVKKDLHVFIFGHGLCEKLLNPYIGVTGKALLLHHEATSQIDDLVAQFISDNKLNLSPALLSPLPVLGIPGWWPENEEEKFYDNREYFRDKKPSH